MTILAYRKNRDIVISQVRTYKGNSNFTFYCLKLSPPMLINVIPSRALGDTWEIVNSQRKPDDKNAVKRYGRELPPAKTSFSIASG